MSTFIDEHRQSFGVDSFHHRRLLEPIGSIPLAELEEEYYRQAAQREHDALKQPSLH